MKKMGEEYRFKGKKRKNLHFGQTWYFKRPKSHWGPKGNVIKAVENTRKVVRRKSWDRYTNMGWSAKSWRRSSKGRGQREKRTQNQALKNSIFRGWEGRKASKGEWGIKPQENEAARCKRRNREKKILQTCWVTLRAQEERQQKDVHWLWEHGSLWCPWLEWFQLRARVSTALERTD